MKTHIENEPPQSEADFLSLLPSLKNYHLPKSYRLHLTQRQLSILDLLLQSRALTGKQIAIGCQYSLSPNSAQSYQRDLRKLVSLGLIDKLPHRHVWEPAVYLFTHRCKLGFRLLRERYSDEDIRNNLYSLGSLPHLLGINDIRVRVIRATRELNWHLIKWFHHEQLAEILNEEKIYPDGYFHIQRNSNGEIRNAHFFLEFQRANRSSKVMESKLKRYGELYYSGRYQEIFGTRALRVLFVFTSDTDSPVGHRINTGVSLATKLGVTIARFTSLDEIKGSEPNQILIGQLWSDTTAVGPLFQIT